MRCVIDIINLKTNWNTPYYLIVAEEQNIYGRACGSTNYQKWQYNIKLSGYGNFFYSLTMHSPWVFIVSCKAAIKVIKLPLLLVGSPTSKKAQNLKLRSIMDNIRT